MTRTTHALRLALTLAIAAAGLPALTAGAARAEVPAFVTDSLGLDVQGMRFCRPGERPTRPGQCLLRNGRPLI